MRRFEDKAALVTGAASGIGRATALRLANEGAKVACVDIDAKGLAKTLELIDGEAHAITCNLSEPAAVLAAMDEAVGHLGALHALCNIAGILKAQHTHEVALEDWNQIIAVNLTGTFLMSQVAIPHLLETRGAIVNASSTAAIAGHPWMAAYAASKGGILSMTRSMAIEYADRGLRVNAVVPGGIATPMHGHFAMPKGANGKLLKRIMPLDAFGEPEAVAATVAFLASEDARYVTGADIRVDGGMLS